MVYRRANLAGALGAGRAAPALGRFWGIEVSVEARILIVAPDDAWAGRLSEGLDQLGWRTLTARGPHAAIEALAGLRIEAVFIDASGPSAAGLARRLKAVYAPRRLPVVGVGETRDQDGHPFDLLLTPPLAAGQAAQRLHALVRLAVAREEFELRVETFAERGRLLEAPEVDGGPLRVLAVGEPAPRFLTLSNALREAGADVVGAFTAYTAFDFLHERNFEAVVLWASEGGAEALSIATGMRRNTRLFHIPALLRVEDVAAATPAEIYDKGVSDVAWPGESERDTALRVIELAGAFRRQTSVRLALERARSSGLMDAATGLFTRDLFAAHLRRLSHASRDRNRPLTVCVLRLADSPAVSVARAGGWLDRAIPQIGAMIGRLVRVEDTAARLGAELFALALPATDLDAGRKAGERIAAVIACTAFNAGDAAPFVVEFDLGVAEVRPGESAARALEAAAASAMQRQAS